MEKLKIREEQEQKINSFLKSTLKLLDLVSSDPNPHKITQKYPKAISAAKNKILSLLGDEVRQIQSL